MSLKATSFRNTISTYTIYALTWTNNDIANQGIFQRARKFDKIGQRTVGIITKPDLINKVMREEKVEEKRGKMLQFKPGAKKRRRQETPPEELISDDERRFLDEEERDAKRIARQDTDYAGSSPTYVGRVEASLS